MPQTPIFDNLLEQAYDDIFDVGLLVMLTEHFGTMIETEK